MSAVGQHDDMLQPGVPTPDRCRACETCRARAVEALRLAQRAAADGRLGELERRLRAVEHASGDTMLGGRLTNLERTVEAHVHHLTELHKSIGYRVREAVRTTWRAWLQVLA